MKHTNPPWTTDPETMHESVIADGKLVADCTIFGLGFTKERNRANARRIVACVNALEHLTTEEIERGVFAFQPRGEWPKLVQQRDELLAALKCLVNERQPLGIDRPEYQAALSAIIKAEADK